MKKHVKVRGWTNPFMIKDEESESKNGEGHHH